MNSDESIIDEKILVKKYSDGVYSLYEYQPTFMTPLYIDFEPMLFPRRVRLALEWIGERHYLVYYLAVDSKLIGHCIIAPGARRLKRSSRQDIVVGPYLIDEKQRGKGYSKVLIQLSLECCSYDYEYAYDFISKDNIASLKATETCGFSVCGELDIVGIFRKLVERKSGEGTYYIYRKMKMEST